MKININLPEMEDGNDFELFPPDIDTELEYDDSKHDWQCANHRPILPKSHWTFTTFTSFTFHFCSNCILRKNCPDGDFDSVSMNYGIIMADLIEAENRLIRLDNSEHNDLDNLDLDYWDHF